MLNVKLAVISVLLFVSLFVSAFARADVMAATDLRGYREWKSDKIQVVMNRISTAKTQVAQAKAEANVKNAQAFERQLSQEQWNLDVAKDLSVTDYFLLYLTQQNQRDRYYRAAIKLNPSEVAELMEAYSKAIGTSEPTPSVSIPTQAVSLGKGL